MKSNGMNTIWWNVIKIEKEKNGFQVTDSSGGINILTRFCLPQAVLPIQRDCKLDQRLEIGINNEVFG